MLFCLWQSTLSEAGSVSPRLTFALTIPGEQLAIRIASTAAFISFDVDSEDLFIHVTITSLKMGFGSFQL